MSRFKIYLLLLAFSGVSACGNLEITTSQSPTVVHTATAVNTPVAQQTKSEPTAVASATDSPTAPTPTSVEVTETSAPSQVDTVAQWSMLEVTLMGPDSSGMDAENNPFPTLVDVVFSGPDGQEYVVPAFYDGDGNGSMDGNVWKARFTPDVAGEWSYTSRSARELLDGQTGQFAVTAVPECAPYVPGTLPDLGCFGRLEYVGDPYLKFANGPYWLKGGADEPEDFLAPDQTVGFVTKQEAIDYLAVNGVNSLYILLHNVGGDSRNVWPWAGNTEQEAKQNNDRFNVAKLDRWNDIFTYLQEQGIVLHLVLEDDSAWNGFDRALYYREMVARFAHHNGLIWNVAEEYNELYSPDEIISFAQRIRALDPYDHPITVHHQGGLKRWEPFVGVDSIDMTSFQTNKTPRNDAAVEWAEKVAAAGRVIPISIDETGQFEPKDRDLARHVVWATYLGGANYEIFTRLPNDGYVVYANFFADITMARTFLEEVPYWEMRPANELIVDGDGYVLAKEAEVYIAYLPSGDSIVLDLTAIDGEFNVTWLNPRSGERLSDSTVLGGSIQNVTAPFDSDAVLRLVRAETQ